MKPTPYSPAILAKAGGIAAVKSYMKYINLKNTQISYKNLRDKFDSNYVDLFKNIFISDISQTEEVRKLIKEFTTEANNLRPIRNAIVHNSLGLMFERKETGEMEMIGFEIENKTKQNKTYPLTTILL